ncbi:MAG: hypothetical protein GY725_19485 [bacterium]|nr:hypothetical protein [bacterium]
MARSVEVFTSPEPEPPRVFPPGRICVCISTLPGPAGQYDNGFEPVDLGLNGGAIATHASTLSDFRLTSTSRSEGFEEGAYGEVVIVLDFDLDAATFFKLSGLFTRTDGGRSSIQFSGPGLAISWKLSTDGSLPFERSGFLEAGSYFLLQETGAGFPGESSAEFSLVLPEPGAASLALVALAALVAWRHHVRSGWRPRQESNLRPAT